MWVNEAMACLKTRRNFANKKMERRLAAWHAVNEDRKSRSRCVNGEKRRCQRRKRALPEIPECGIKLREWGSFLWLSQVKHKVNQMNLKPLHSVISAYTPNARSKSTFHRVKRLQWSERKETKCWRTASFKEPAWEEIPSRRERVCSHWQTDRADHAGFRSLNQSSSSGVFPTKKKERISIVFHYYLTQNKTTNNKNISPNIATKRNKTQNQKKKTQTCQSFFFFALI